MIKAVGTFLGVGGGSKKKYWGRTIAPLPPCSYGHDDTSSKVASDKGGVALGLSDQYKSLKDIY